MFPGICFLEHHYLWFINDIHYHYYYYLKYCLNRFITVNCSILAIDKSGLRCQSRDLFKWQGAKATFGVKTGEHCQEMYF